MSYFTAVDIANRALQHLGVPRITAFTDSNRPAREANFALPKLRRAELQRSVWTFATRRAVLRAVTSTTKDITFATYAAATTYDAGDIVEDSTGFLWLSRKGTNTGNTPGSESADPYWVPYFGPVVAAAHSTTVSYLPGDIVYVSTTAYICILAHTNQLPPNATYWVDIAGATVAAIITLSPLGYSNDGAAQKNIHRLPANFLRMAPQDPKAAAAAVQNVTAGMQWNDWEVEAPHLFTDDADPIVLRFVADQTDVSQMDPLFCEVWAARAALELAEPLTASAQRKVAAAGLYAQYTDMARAINAIEAGTTEQEPAMQAAQVSGRGQQ